MKGRTYILILFVLVCTQNLLSQDQNINGLKIYVSKLYATTLYFHDVYIKRGFGETTSPYKFNSLLSDEKSIALEVLNDVKEPYTLYVTEGGRKHKFIILYKERLEDSERDIYFTDLNKLTELVKTTNSEPTNLAPKSESVQTAPSQIGTTAVVKNTIIDSVERDEIKYTGLVTKANTSFSSNKFDDALKYYTAALAIKPDDIYLNTQVQVIQRKINEAKINEDARRSDSSFQSYIDAGDKLSNDKSYVAAKIAYGEALKIKSDDPIALARLQAAGQNIVADSLKAQQQKKEKLYVQFLNLGDTAAIKKSYGAARIAYEQALQVKPNDAVATDRLRRLNQNVIEDSLDAVNQKNIALYTNIIKRADKALDENSLSIAKSIYDSALIVKSKDTYASGQIKKIDNILIEQQRQAQREIELQKNEAIQKQYSDLVSKADQEYDSEMYDEASKDYAKALEINKNDEYSKNRIIQIKSQVNARQLKIKQDSADNAKYFALIKKADNAFNLNDFTNSILFYRSALTHKDNDEYANNRITEIENIVKAEEARKQAGTDSLNKINEANKRYVKLISDAQKAYDARDYTAARIMYSEATGLQSNETEARNKLAAIDSELAVIAEKQVTQNKADSLITEGEISLATKQFPVALDYFEDAMALNLPEQQYYLQRQIRYTQDQITIIEKQNEKQAEDEQLKRSFDTAMSAYNKGNNAIKYSNYDDAIMYFKKLLNIVGNMDTATLQKSQYNLLKIITYSRKKIVDLENAISKANVTSAKKDTTQVVKRPIAYGSYAPTIYYPNPKDPALKYVYEKYPDIDFYSSPPEQHFDSLLHFNIQSNLISREIMSLKPDLELTDSSHGVKLICQNIIFKYNNIYLKFLVQNYDSVEFLTGRMLLSYKPNNKDSVKLYPDYVANYPIILGGRQKVLVYVTKPITINDAENLRFEMVDRLNKLKLMIDIPVSAYNIKEQKTEKH
jgi:tetratricopeptide (TPR) repeat protein